MVLPLLTLTQLVFFSTILSVYLLLSDTSKKIWKSFGWKYVRVYSKIMPQNKLEATKFLFRLTVVASIPQLSWMKSSRARGHPSKQCKITVHTNPQAHFLLTVVEKWNYMPFKILLAKTLEKLNSFKHLNIGNICFITYKLEDEITTGPKQTNKQTKSTIY